MERAMTHHDDTWIRTGALLAGLGVAGYYGARWLTAAPPAAAATLPPPRPSSEPRPKAAISAAPRHLPIIDVGPVTSPDQVEAPAVGGLPRHFDPIFERHRGSIPIEFLRALAMRESGMNPSARGTAAWGLLQIVEVVRHAFNQAHGTHYTRAQLLDPEVNVPIAAWLLRRIVDGYQRHHADVANLRTDWRNPRFVELVVFGWNAGMSEAAGVGRVVEYLKRRGHRAIDLDLVHEHAQAAGASRHLSNPAKVRWSRSVADLYAQERGFRNASWWAVKTPGVILAEMNITNADVSAIGRDIYATFRQPWEAEYDKARARFRTERGRDPGVGKDSDPAAEWATVYGWMTPRPSAEDIRWKTYQGAFVHSWGEFEREWLAWYASNKGTYARMWRGTYDQALDYRKRARQWREQFQALGGVPSAPAPHIPVEGGPLGDLSLSRVAVIAGVVVGAAVAGPPILRALQKERAS
jgi:hypothetical protein